jgi:hypothetical protein
MQYEMEQYMLSTDGRLGSKLEKKKHRDFLKEHFKQLPPDIMDVYEKSVGKGLRISNTSRKLLSIP